MTAPPPDAELFALLERYYDEVPRAYTTVHEVGPFTLFLRTDETSWPYYARPRLGEAGPFTAADVERVRQRQRDVGAPETFEWVHETTPGLAEAVRNAGVQVTEHPLMVLGTASARAAHPPGCRVEVLDADRPELGDVTATVEAGFGETDDVAATPPSDALRARLRSGLVRLVGAFDEAGPVGGGSHSPRRGVTELAGIGVLPRARHRGVGAAITSALVDDARSLGVHTVFLSAGSQRVADIYARVGFVAIGTACIAEASR